MTTGWLGGSNVRSPRPSETNTITFCRSPFASVITSWEKTATECCWAQLGSAAMLISFGFGTVPSNLTTPRTVAPPVVVAAGGPPALALKLPAKQRVKVNATADWKADFFDDIELHLNSESVRKQLFSARRWRSRPKAIVRLRCWRRSGQNPGIPAHSPL